MNFFSGDEKLFSPFAKPWREEFQLDSRAIADEFVAFDAPKIRKSIQRCSYVTAVDFGAASQVLPALDARRFLGRALDSPT